MTSVWFYVKHHVKLQLSFMQKCLEPFRHSSKENLLILVQLFHCTLPKSLYFSLSEIFPALGTVVPDKDLLMQ